MGWVDFAPVRSPCVVRIELRFERASQPVDVHGGKALGGKTLTSVAVGPLGAAMAPDKGGIFFTVVRKIVVSGNARIAAFERAHLKTNEPGDNAILLPFLVGFDLEIFLARIIVFPEVNSSLRDLGGIGVRSVLFSCDEAVKEVASKLAIMSVGMVMRFLIMVSFRGFIIRLFCLNRAES